MASALGLIEQLQYQDKGTDMETLILGVLRIIQTELIEPAQELERQASVLTAEGVNLDNIGERYGEPRVSIARSVVDFFGFDDNGVGFDQAPFAEETGAARIPIADEIFRRYIIARGGQLITDGSVPSMNRILQTAFLSGHYIDNFDMSMIVRIDQSLRDDQFEAILGTGLITKPAGVRLTALHLTHEDGFFGFDDNGVGFDQAPFARIVTNI